MKKQGFTLIEVAFYFAIVGFILLAAMSFAIQILNLTKQSDNFHELQASIDFISKRIVSTVQTGESINDSESIFDNDVGALSLNTTLPDKSPTTFYLSNEAIYMTEGTDPAIKLTSDSIKCTLLRFQKISYPKTPDQIIIDAEFQNLSFHTSVSLRKL